MGVGVAITGEQVVARLVFTAGGLDYTWGDVLVAARLRGDWAPLEEDTRRGLAALAGLHSRGEEIEEADAAAAGNAFRYERDLLSGDELEAWLGRWDLDLVEWGEWIGWTLARERCEQQIEELVEEHCPEQDQVEAAAGIEAICSGALERWAGELAGRVAVALACGGYIQPGPPPDPPPARGVLAIPPSGWFAAAEKVASCDRPPEGVVDDTALAREVSLNRLDWLSLECRRVRLPEDRMAREALLCLREDGLGLEQVAALAKARVENVHLVLDDAPEALRPCLVGATVGELIGPVEEAGGFALLIVDGKRAPDISDPEILARAHRCALERALGREIDARVHWHERI